MSRHRDYRSSTGTLDSSGSRWDSERFSREHERRRSRGPPPVAERPRRVEEERFEVRLRDEDRYGPPARRVDRYYEDETVVRGAGPMVVAYDQRRHESPPPPPRLIRRQSSLDTFDRVPARKRESYSRRAAPMAVPVPLPPSRRRSPPRRYQEQQQDFYEDIRIAEPDLYGDEEYRDFREQRRRSSSHGRYREKVVEEMISEKVEKPYPRKGRTRMPRRLVHTQAIIELGYPFVEEDNVVVIQKALSKDQIDEVISVSRDIRRSESARYVHSPSPPPPRRERFTEEKLVLNSFTPRSSRNTLIVERSPSQHRSRSRYRGEVVEKKQEVTTTISRPRSVSVHFRNRRPSSPPAPRRVERREVREEIVESEKLRTNPMALVIRPRHSDSHEDLHEYIRELEEEKRLLQLERRGGVDIIERDTEIIDSKSGIEEVVKVKKDHKAMDKVQAFGKNLSASFSPFAARTQQMIKEQLGQADDRTQLPDEYIELEKRVDALKLVHQKLLQVTSQYSNEAYDYPPNIRESFNDLGRTISEKVTLLSQASSPGEAQAALTAPPSAKPQPKTFNHAIARASLAGSQTLAQSSHDEDPLATALEKYALAEEKVGEARLAQDAQIQSRFLAGWNTTLNTNLMFAAKARKNVENSRLMLDSVKASKKAAARGDLDNLSEEARIEIEQAEDEFVGQTEEAVSVMKNVLDTPEPLRNLADLIAAQLEFHKRAYEILSELAPVVDGLQVEQEASYRKSREGA
ncbi:hypothetical protein ASPZODRAFT_159561 [Penicilliopsis zonata CBS 506.65]|uniref:DUF8035 domain-containing protein n=1 Tax=Penicilliopsis zonata CBS 506.65 TaxID=1073090 RepID=A0A1L9SHT5_9EURO|nr:hypothetical protein ASPZODRAFT_159561 [Penicilliopsis zonata CBS 506.65]OJJ46772.1 hypothetical protein ASPZODRAFT_159561 [Penicilliopsis zonata CBS 506.65]